jgi:two-component system nitrate/nitrite sensor histidine kinase NarX
MRLGTPTAPVADASLPDDWAAPCSTADQDLRVAIEPVLEAIVRLAGAAGGAVNVTGHDGMQHDPVVGVGIVPGMGALSSWCASCAESRRTDSECVRDDLCGHDERLRADVLGPVCKHVMAVPLRHQDQPVGTLTLWFAAPGAAPAPMTPLLRAVGDLVGTALDNARLARENMRIRLTSERQMLANEVHDSLAQGLAYMRMRMSLLRDAVRNGDELRAHKLVSDVDETLGNSQRRLRELITYFRTRMDPRGLVHALDEVAARFLDRTGIALTFVNRIPDLCLPAEREIEVFHVVQEALANIARHAHAYSATLLLERAGDAYVVVIEDDGVGLPESSVGDDPDHAGHYGIAIMNERARRLGGTIALTANADRGTRLELKFPATLPAEEQLP